MKRLFIALSICLVLATGTACNIFSNSAENVSGLTTTTFTKFENETINGISVSGIWNTTITQGTSTKVTITVPEKFKDWYSFTLNNGTLIVSRISNSIASFKYTFGDNPFKIDIVCSSLENIISGGGSNINLVGDFNSDTLEITSSGGADIDGTGKINCTEAEINISGGADMELNAIAQNTITASASGGADMFGNFEANNIKVKVSGGADMELIGTTNTLIISASGGADLSAKDLVAQDADVKASGGADVEIHAVKSLKVSKSGGADVSYKGNPTISQQVKGLKKLD